MPKNAKDLYPFIKVSASGLGFNTIASKKLMEGRKDLRKNEYTDDLKDDKSSFIFKSENYYQLYFKISRDDENLYFEVHDEEVADSLRAKIKEATKSGYISIPISEFNNVLGGDISYKRLPIKDIKMDEGRVVSFSTSRKSIIPAIVEVNM